MVLIIKHLFTKVLLISQPWSQALLTIPCRAKKCEYFWMFDAKITPQIMLNIVDWVAALFVIFTQKLQIRQFLIGVVRYTGLKKLLSNFNLKTLLSIKT